MKSSPQSGFTLVELTIVIVIIGLILGGVLYGKEMIEAAEIRSVTQQVEDYNAAATTFRVRYKGIPGDIENAASFIDPADWPNVANGDDSGKLTDADPASTYATKGDADEFTGELAQFWHQLSAVKLLKGFYDTTSVLGKGFPEARTRGCGIIIANLSGLNGDGIYVHKLKGHYFQIGAVSSSNPGTNDVIQTTNCLTPSQANRIDSKIDDGYPVAGKVRAAGSYDNAGGNGTVPGLGRMPRVFELSFDMPIPANFMFSWLVSSAYATTSVATLPQSCVTYTAGAGKSGYNYAVLGEGIECQMLLRAPF